MRNDPSLDYGAPGSASTATPPFVREAAKQLARQGLTTDALHPIILEFLSMAAKHEGMRSGKSAKAARRRAEEQARTIKQAGLAMQLHVLYLYSRGDRVKVAMTVLSTMLGFDLPAFRWLVSLGDEQASRS